MVSTEQLQAFGRDGYLVVPSVIDGQRQAAALALIDKLLQAEPPADGHTGHHFYWRETADEPVLTELLTAAPAFSYISQLLAPLRSPGPPKTAGGSDLPAV
ncbi:MAG TPA: hypothetical protein DGG94_23285 [Micromonosporaceae bacterium]|nr:hypothetical protein [Micromonosporaceae bacterium]HCU52676.1 hypothetical protein [Micromonosporaceae bacterium]